MSSPIVYVITIALVVLVGYNSELPPRKEMGIRSQEERHSCFGHLPHPSQPFPQLMPACLSSVGLFSSHIWEYADSLVRSTGLDLVLYYVLNEIGV